MARTVADQFAETLAAAGVKRIYGLVGDSLNGLTDALRRQGKIEWVHVRHEEVAAFAAGAEAHLTGELAVCAGSCGPGAGDDKQGAVTAICAMRALKAIGFSDFARITLIVNSNEETGSFGTRKLFREHALLSDVAINLERGVPPDGVLVSRK